MEPSPSPAEPSQPLAYAPPAVPSPSRSRLRAIPGVLFGCIVILLALGNFSVGVYPYGTAVWVRPLFSLLGITAAVLLFARNRWWRRLLPLWCILQIWVIATGPSGEWFFQGLSLGWKYSRSVRSNNVLVEYSASGINFAGLVLLLILAIIALFHLHPAIRHPIRRKHA